MYLNKLLDTKVHPNTMYTEAGPVIETPLSAAASVHDMLLTSWGDRIRVFPGVPASWKDVTFYHLRAQGAFLVSAVRKGGATQFVQIESLAGEPCRVWSVGDGVVEIGLKKGESVTLYPKNSHPDFTIAAVAEQKDRCNFWGLNDSSKSKETNRQTE
jgi:alpha-L-fucosidase 2